MAGIDDSFIKEVIEKSDIVEVTSGFIHLEKRGNAYWACCPFHHEKTPSFRVDGNLQVFHCFGCGASGNVISIVKEMESCDFLGAIRYLADRLKMPIPQSSTDSERTVALKKKRDNLIKILNETAHFYLNNLNSGNADEHINYILSRKIPSKIVRSFGLGASLNYNDLPRYLLSKGYDKADMLDSGVVSEADGRLIDSLGGRLIFPIINALDEVIGFGGRALKKTERAKYKNTKETTVFNKRKTLYNINGLKKFKRTQAINGVIMVEGYMDTISLVQAGFGNVVASMGTSLTQEQARLIKRYSDTVYISYDGDGAGQKANLRGLEILQSEGLTVKVVPLPEGLDPDDVIKQQGAEGYRACLDAALPLIDYKLAVARRQYDITKPDDKVKYVSDAIEIIKSAESSAQRELLLKKLRDETGVSYESLNRDLQSAPQVKTEAAAEKPKPKKDAANAHTKASRFVIASYLFGARYTEDTPLDSIVFDDGVHSLIAGYIRSKRLFEEKITLSELFEFFEEGSPEREELGRILELNDGEKMDGEVNEKTFNDCLRRLKSDALDGAIEQVKKSFSAAENAEERAKYAGTLQKLIMQKEKLKGGTK